MTDERSDKKAVNDKAEGAGPVVERAEPKIMCYVSKEMVPLSETVEVEYSPGKKFRVMPKYIRFGDDAAES